VLTSDLVLGIVTQSEYWLQNLLCINTTIQKHFLSLYKTA
jgi:hypothetical protein